MGVLVRRLVVAGCPAGFAIKQAIDAQSHVQLRLTVHAEFLAGAVPLGPFTLGANDAASGFDRHASSLVRTGSGINITEVTQAKGRSKSDSPLAFAALPARICRPSRSD